MPIESLSGQCWDVVLRDGSTLAVRPASEPDIPHLVTFLNSLSDESRYFRFFGMRSLTPLSVARLLPSDPHRGRAIVGQCGARIVAFASFHRTHPASERAEVAFAIADALQGRGVGTRLLERLADIGRSDGIGIFDAYVMGTNRKMMAVFVNSGFRVVQQIEHGVFHVELSLEPTPDYLEKSASRSQVAATASIRPFFEPKVVAVVGANRERGKIGSEILHNLIAAGFTGTVIPIHPSATAIAGLPAYKRVSDVPCDVDLAVIAVPARQVPDVVDDCLTKGVRGLCVISAGFGEAGAEGRTRELQLLDKVRAAGCRLIGPNCMGALNTDAAFRLNATFSPVYPPAGNVAMSTQSGALGLAILDYARELNIGISSFVSVGNKVDVSGNDLIQYWAEDPRTAVILLYLESFGNPKKFGEIARRVGRRKPIVAVKAGRSSAGSRAASSHTGALAASDVVVDALLRHAGVIRTNTLEELFDVAALLAHQPIPRGRRVAILTNAGGPGILAADACEANGLELVPLSEVTRRELRSFLPEAASVGNPVDMLASAPAAHYGRALTALLQDDNVDSVLTIFIPPLITEADAVASAVVAASTGRHDKTVAGIFMRSAGAPSALAPVPCYAFPESAAIALARATAYGEWKRKPAGTAPSYSDIPSGELRAIADAVLERGGGWLTVAEVDALLDAAGIEKAPARLAATIDDAVAAAALLGFPVALKAIGPTLLHKTERQAVQLNLADADAVRRAAVDLEGRLAGELTGMLIQRMVPGGVEMLVGALNDPSFGPLLVCGTGGVLVDLLGDSVFRMHPLTAEDAKEMIDELRGVRLLRGYRGAPPVDEATLREVLLRVSTLITLCPEIVELDLNPVKVLPSGACALDARIRIERPARPRTRRVEY